MKIMISISSISALVCNSSDDIFILRNETDIELVKSILNKIIKFYVEESHEYEDFIEDANIDISGDDIVNRLQRNFTIKKIEEEDIREFAMYRTDDYTNDACFAEYKTTIEYNTIKKDCIILVYDNIPIGLKYLILEIFDSLYDHLG